MKPDDALWMVIYMARGARQADSVEALLTAEGFLVRRRAVGNAQQDGTFELMVLRSEGCGGAKVSFGQQPLGRGFANEENRRTDLRRRRAGMNAAIRAVGAHLPAE